MIAIQDLKAAFRRFADQYLEEKQSPQSRRMQELKFEHSITVLEVAQTLGRMAKLLPNDQMILNCAAMFHDAGRFPEARDTQSWVDGAGFDHGEYAIELIFMEDGKVSLKKIEKFFPGAKNLLQEDPIALSIIALTIANHAKKQIGEGYVCAKTLCNLDRIQEKFGRVDESVHQYRYLWLAKLLRDADKIAVFYLITDPHYAKNHNLWLAINPTMDASQEPLESSMISDEVMACIEAKSMVDIKFRQTTADCYAVYLSWVFDLTPIGLSYILSPRHVETQSVAGYARSSENGLVLYEKIFSNYVGIAQKPELLRQIFAIRQVADKYLFHHLSTTAKQDTQEFQYVCQSKDGWHLDRMYSYTIAIFGKYHL